MQWHDFIYSTQPQRKNLRHLLFWFLWWMYIVFVLFFTQPFPESPNVKSPLFFHHQPGLSELGFGSYSFLVLVKSFFLLLTHVFYCYTIIYILIPWFLLKRRYLPMLVGLLGAGLLILPIGYFLYSFLYPLIDSLFYLDKPLKNIVWRSIDASLLNAIKVTLVAAAIILLKRWWRQQKDKERLEKEKINAELQLLKAQIQPEFIFNTLNTIIEHAQVASPSAPEMLIELSDLLSYMLYESDEPKVKLEKEIGMVKEYLALEKIRQGKSLDMNFQVSGNLHGLLISPLLLLPFVNYSLSYCSNKLLEQAWLNIDISIQGTELSMKIISGIPAGDIDKIIDEQLLVNVKRRLQLFYPGRHELKINVEEELILVHLNLKLEELTLDNINDFESSKTVLSYAGI